MRLFKREKNERLLSPMLIAPVILMALIALALVILATGRSRQMEERKVSFLKTQDAEKYCGESSNAPYLLLYDSSDEESTYLKDTTAAILDDMRLSYRSTDVSKETIEYSGIETMFLCMRNLSILQGQFDAFAKWITAHNLIWLCMPEYSDEFAIIYRSLGISYCVGTFEDNVNGLRFHDDFLYGLKGVSLPGLDLHDVAIKVTLESDARLHISDTGSELPLVWSYERQNGSRVVMFNTGILYERNNVTGLITSAITEIEDTLVWPVINGLTIFIDDFPAPQPEGYDERLKKQFGYSTKSFFMNIWWPQMKELSEKLGVSYTGVLIEDYNDNTSPPFTPGTADSLLQYYGAEILSEGGEIALHGYNHQPLIMEGTPTADNYPGWPSIENMKLATAELLRYAKMIFPDNPYLSYVPPSNNLGKEGVEALIQTVPSLKVISGVYYDEDGGMGFRTDFEETEDGIIYYPRVSSELASSQDNIFRIYCMLYSKGVFSHFIHPDDVLDEERGADLGWKVLYERFSELLQNVKDNYPVIRGLTASSGGGAVQRYQRVRYQTEETENSLMIHLEPFEDEVWLALSCKEKNPVSVDGAEINKLADGLFWLCCKDTEVKINWAGEGK